MNAYPKRLIEIDLPIKRISIHARREKSIRHGHISTLHVWWARRPLAACRAVICAALWPAPTDPTCPLVFVKVARTEMLKWTQNQRLNLLGAESQARFQQVQKNPTLFDDVAQLQQALFDFIADFANWDNSTKKEYLETSQALTQAAHEALGGLSGTRPLVVDPFAGGGSIPLEALRVGADAFASDLNPVAVLLNKVVLEYIPKYGQQLADEVRKWGQWIKDRVQKELTEFYPKDPDEATPIAYLWARTVRCEGPGCGAEVPLLRSLWLAKRQTGSVALRLVPKETSKQIELQIIENAKAQDVSDGTIKQGAVSCPCCGFTTPVKSVRQQLKLRNGGTNDARLLCVVTTNKQKSGRKYRLPTNSDLQAVENCRTEIQRKETEKESSIVPDERISLNELRRISLPLYGMSKWGDVFTSRQNMALSTLIYIFKELCHQLDFPKDKDLQAAILTCLAFAIDRQADYYSSLVIWSQSGEFVAHTFGRQALPMVWDFAEPNLWADTSGNWMGAVEWIARVCAQEGFLFNAKSTSNSHAEQASATSHPLPDDFVQALITDPPYYDAVPYSHLSDFFYVWMKRSLGDLYPTLFANYATPKDGEIVVDRAHTLSESTKDIGFYEKELTKAFTEARRILSPAGIGTIVFASKTTASWEAILQACLDAGWVITGSWPIDTEREARVSAQGQARLGSSIHVVARPRENPDGSLRTNDPGDWRDVLQELPRRIHAWLPRLANEGVVGADAIFACLGPALEIFSRHSHVEKANGDPVSLGEYLEAVWAAVSKEALAMVFAGADTSGFEEDARLTAMWLWTLSSSKEDQGTEGNSLTDDSVDEDEETVPGQGRKQGDKEKGSKGGYSLEYDAARKIAQGLGAHLEQLSTLIQVKGSDAHLLSVRDRSKYLFGKVALNEPEPRSRKAKQPTLFDAIPDVKAADWEFQPDDDFQPGVTTLDRVHQSMLLFQAGRSDALKRFLVEQGIGQNERFWRLAQAFSALYPPSSEEKRWIDGVLARKKGLGL